jgi:hypothetical protein
MQTPLKTGLFLISVLIGCGSSRSAPTPEVAPEPEATEQPAPAPAPAPEPAQATIGDDVACAETSDCVATKYPGCCGCLTCPSDWYAWSQAWVEKEKRCDMTANCVGCAEAIDVDCAPEPATAPTAACVEGRCVLVRE